HLSGGGLSRVGPQAAPQRTKSQTQGLRFLIQSYKTTGRPRTESPRSTLQALRSLAMASDHFKVDRITTSILVGLPESVGQTVVPEQTLERRIAVAEDFREKNENDQAHGAGGKPGHHLRKAAVHEFE